jgi:hypothetical protein
LAATVKDYNINLFPAVTSEAGRTKKMTTETPDEETEQSTAAALEEAHREREQPSHALPGDRSGKTHLLRARMLQ